MLQLLVSASRALGEHAAEGRALWQAGATLTEAGHWRDAEPPLTQSLAILEAELGAASLDIARVCNSLSIVYYKVPLSRNAMSSMTRQCSLVDDTTQRVYPVSITVPESKIRLSVMRLAQCLEGSS